jgi:hypothetical protein
MLDHTDFPSAIAFAFEAVGGIGAAARVCNRSRTNGVKQLACHERITQVKPNTLNCWRLLQRKKVMGSKLLGC